MAWYALDTQHTRNPAKPSQSSDQRCKIGSVSIPDAPAPSPPATPPRRRGVGGTAAIVGGLFLAAMLAISIAGRDQTTGPHTVASPTVHATLTPLHASRTPPSSALDKLAAYARGGHAYLLTYVKTRDEGLPACPGRDAIFTAPATLRGVRLAKAEAAAFVRAGLGHTKCTQDTLSVFPNRTHIDGGAGGTIGTVTYNAPGLVEVDVGMSAVALFK